MQGVDPLHDRHFPVRKRDGRVEEFNEARILLALEAAFKAHLSLTPEDPLPDSVQSAVKLCADRVVERVLSRAVRGAELEVEGIQDAAEDQLMADGHHEVARRYILYREDRRRARVERELRANFRPPRRPARPLAKDTVFPRQDPVPDERLLAQERLRAIYSQALPKARPGENLNDLYRRHFDCCLNEGEFLRGVTAELLEFDCTRLARALRPERDTRFTAAALDTLRDLYLAHENGRRIETPQYFWMRIAMGLALNEVGPRESRALEFYEVLSTFRFLPSHPILRHAGAPHPQLSVCHTATSANDLEHLTLQPAGPSCSWLEPWHRDILPFLSRPRPGAAPSGQQLNKALWLPDLFMQRVREQSSWTLFDPADTPGLHRSHGAQFQARYLAFEQKAAHGALPSSRRLNAADLWREILASLLDTGQPWLGFKDAVNTRSAQDHSGLVCAAALGGALLLNADPGEAAACPFGAVNIAAHLTERPAGLDVALLRGTITAAVRMLDNAVDLSAYPSARVRAASLQHRPIGLGVAGFAEALDRLQHHPASPAAADFADWSMELVSYFAILASAELAAERGPYPGYAGSKWSRGILPIDTLALLSNARGLPLDVPSGGAQDWEPVRGGVRRQGVRHCSTTAVAAMDGPARIAGLTPSLDAGQTDPFRLIEHAARRQKWIDLGHALDLPLPPSERDIDKLSNLYLRAWEKGIKTIHQLTPVSESREDPATPRVPAESAAPLEMASAPI